MKHWENPHYSLKPQNHLHRYLSKQYKCQVDWHKSSDQLNVFQLQQMFLFPLKLSFLQHRLPLLSPPLLNLRPLSHPFHQSSTLNLSTLHCQFEGNQEPLNEKEQGEKNQESRLVADMHLKHHNLHQF